MNTESDQVRCAPFWNYRPRLILFYFGPILALGIVLVLVGMKHLEDANRWWEESNRSAVEVWDETPGDEGGPMAETRDVRR